MQPKRILLVVAHPDDETIAAGAHLKLWPELTIVHVTDGAPRDGADAAREGFARWEDYAAARRAELDAAMGAGEASHACRVAYQMADQGAVQRVGEIIERLRQFEPDVVITHAYEGGHPDHDACAMACAAVWGSSECLWEFAGYHNSRNGMRTGKFLNGPPAADTPFPHLSEIIGDHVRRKHRMLECFRTQREILKRFRPDVERFRPAPAYDFEKPPHDGQLLYETWGIPLNGTAWREFARGALSCH